MNIIRISIPNPDELLNDGAFGEGALVRLEASADGETYFEDSTQAIVADRLSYVFYHATGIASTWYRSRYSDAAGTRFSEYSLPFQDSQRHYASVDGVKRRLRWTEESDDPEEELLLQIIGEMNGWMENPAALGCAVAPSSLTELTLDGRDARADGRMLFVRIGIVELSDVQVNGQSITDWYLRPLEQDRRPGWPAQQVWRNGGWPRGFGNITLFGSFGFPAIPLDLVELAETTVVRAWFAARAGQRDISGTDETGQPLVSRYVALRDRDTLREYRRLLALNAGMRGIWMG